MLAGIGVLLVVVVAVLAFSSLNRPTETDYRLARGRALLDAENYLAVLQTLGKLPPGHNTGAEAHSYLGAAYFRLHLYKAAIKEFESAVRLKPGTSDPWVGLASTYIELGDAEKAREQAGHATQVEKGSSDAWIILGRALWMQGNFAEAEKAALKAKELDAPNTAATELLLRIYFDQDQPSKFQSLLNSTPQPSSQIQDMAVAFFVRQGQFGHAYDLENRYRHDNLERRILETQLALQREPDRQDLYPELIKTLVKARHFTEALAAFSKYRGSVPLDIELGKAYWMTGQKDPAIQAFTRAAAARYHKVSAETALAVITGEIRHWREAFRAERVEQDYWILSRLDGALAKADPLTASFIYRYAGIYDASFYNKAVETAQKALEAAPLNLDALLTLGTAYQRLNRLEDARRQLQLASEEYPKSAEAWSRLANVSVQNSDPQTMLEQMDRAVKLEPDNPGYIYNLGWLYDQMGSTSQAAALYERAIRLSPLSFEAMNNLALIYGNAGESDRALRLLEQAVQTDPENEAAYFNLSNYYAERRDWNKAMANLDNALGLNPSNARTAIEKGRILLDLGRTEEAIVILNHALEADPQSLDAYVLLSSSYEQTGNTNEALAALDEAQRIRPDAPEVRTALDRLAGAKDAPK